MTDEIDVLKMALLEHKKAQRIRKLNEELLEHVNGSIHWILRYAERKSIPLKDKEQLYAIMEKSNRFIEEILSKAQESTPCIYY